MTMNDYISDEELTGFLDGELDNVSTRRIEDELTRDSVLGERLAALDIDKASLKGAFGELLSKGQGEVKITSTAPDSRNWLERFSFSGSAIAASLAIVLASGIFFSGYYIANSKFNDWKAYVAAYQRLYVTQTLSAVVDGDASIGQNELDRVATALGRKLTLESMQQVKGLNYKRAQILGFEGRAIAQMTFLTPIGTPIALCILRSDKAADTGIRTETREGMAMASWTSKGYEFMIIGGSDEDIIARSAKLFSESL